MLFKHVLVSVAVLRIQIYDIELKVFLLSLFSI